MGVGKNMILAIFIIPLAFGTKPEFQLRIGFLRPAAHGAFMPGDSGGLFHFPLKFLSAPGLPGRHMNLPSAGYEKYNKIHQGSGDHKLIRDGTHQKLIDQKRPVNNAQNLYPDREQEEHQHLHIGVCAGKGQENRHIHIISAESPGKISGDVHPPKGVKSQLRVHLILKDGRVAEQKESTQYGKEHPRKDINIIAVGSPGPL